MEKAIVKACPKVSKLSSNLDSIFSVFEDRSKAVGWLLPGSFLLLEEKGPHIFNTVADLWVTIWVIYFACLV